MVRILGTSILVLSAIIILPACAREAGEQPYTEQPYTEQIDTEPSGTEINMIAEGSFPHWSSAVNMITFTNKAGDQYEVFIMKPDGSQVKCLTYNWEKL